MTTEETTGRLMISVRHRGVDEPADGREVDTGASNARLNEQIGDAIRAVFPEAIIHIRTERVPGVDVTIAGDTTGVQIRDVKALVWKMVDAGAFWIDAS